MAPSRAVCIGALFRQRQVFFGGQIKQLIGPLVISASAATIITAVLHHAGLRVERRVGFTYLSGSPGLSTPSVPWAAILPAAVGFPLRIHSKATPIMAPTMGPTR